MPNESGDNNSSTARNTGSSVPPTPHTMKIPRFWKENPALWFVQVVAQFDLYRINSEQTKFFSIVAELDTELLTHVSDIVLNPPDDVYSKMKQRLIEHFSVSEEKRIKQLLNNLEIGDKKPSILLREMRNLAKDGVKDDFLRTMWMQRLPSHSQAILSTSTESLDNLAKMADKIADISIPNGVSSLSAQNSSFDFREMTRQIETLTATVHQLQDRRPRNNSRVRSRSNRRDNSKSNICYYHRRFGQKASKCRQPCTFLNNQQSGN